MKQRAWVSVSYGMSIGILTLQLSVTLTTKESLDFSSWSANCCSHLWCLVPRNTKRISSLLKGFPFQTPREGMFEKLVLILVIE